MAAAREFGNALIVQRNRGFDECFFADAKNKMMKRGLAKDGHEPFSAPVGHLAQNRRCTVSPHFFGLSLRGSVI